MPISLALTREQSRQVDRIAIDDYGIPGVVLMENAGRGCVELLEAHGLAGPVTICCGRGNNGGDGFVIARHLAIRGYQPRVLLVPSPEELQGDALINYRILTKAGMAIEQLPRGADPATTRQALEQVADTADWIVDALLGTGATGAPRAPYNTLIEAMNASPVKKFAVDVPSGLDCDSGQPSRPTVKATLTATFVAPKVGYQQPSAAEYLGELQVVDIGIPPGLAEKTYTP